MVKRVFLTKEKLIKKKYNKMNLFIRYFDKETLATNIDEAMDFLDSIEDFKIENNVAGRIQAFLDSNNTYPFRLKVSYSNYVLFLKTDASSIDEFKEMEMLRKQQKADGVLSPVIDRKKTILDILNEEKPGWYEGSILFKRVVQIPETNKFQYKDTRFVAQVKANSAMECYNRIIEHLQNRQEIDRRSQFPSAKSNNFEYKFLCEE